MLPNVSAAALLAEPYSPAGTPKQDVFDFESLLTAPPSFAKPKPVPLPNTGQRSGVSTLPYKGGALPVTPLNIGTYDPNHGTHITDGLDWNHGRKTAQDIMAKPGTPVNAWVGGTVERLGSAQGGQSMYFKADNGEEYWLGHIDGRYSLPAGTRVSKGQLLTRISADHAAPHLHIDSRPWR